MPDRIIVSVVEDDADLHTPVIVFTQARTGQYDGFLQGVLQAAVPLSDFVRRFSPRFAEQTVNQLLIDASGRIIISAQNEQFLLPIISDPLQLQEVIAVQKSDKIGFAQGMIAGDDSYYAFAALENPSWTALTIQSKDGFDKLLNQLIIYCILIGLFGLLFGCLLAHLMGLPILDNIRQIKQQAQYLAEGKLDQRVSMASGDELEDLAGAVNFLTDQLLETSQARDSLSLMLRTVNDPLIIADENGLILKTNPAAQSMFKITEEDFVGRHLSCCFAVTSPFSSTEELRQHFSQGDFKNYETEVRDDADLTLAVLFSGTRCHQDGAGNFIVSIFKDISAQKTAEQKISRLAYYDGLTGLPNRSLMRNRLEQTLALAERDFRAGFHFELMFIDLDHFKVVNDTLAHSVGDQLLQEAAQRLTDCLRRSDTVGRTKSGLPQDDESEQLLARLGGDEFIILLPRLRSSDDAALVARRIIEDMGKPFVLGSHEVVTPASVGIALYPDDGKDAETLLRHADVAMYHAKEQGRNSFSYYPEEMNRSARDRLFLENRLRADIDKRQGFRVEYQPKVNVQTGQVCGMEALVRWENEEVGSVSPARFIPIAEETGLIVPLGRWILETSCHQLHQWLAQGGPALKIAVNLSGRQLKQTDLVAMISEVLAETGLDPQ